MEKQKFKRRDLISIRKLVISFLLLVPLTLGITLSKDINNLLNLNTTDTLKNSKEINLIQGDTANSYLLELSEKSSIISSVGFSLETGTYPFDEDKSVLKNSATELLTKYKNGETDILDGYDPSKDDNIVRTFDTIMYTLSPDIINDNILLSSDKTYLYISGDLKVIRNGELLSKENITNLVSWNFDKLAERAFEIIEQDNTHFVARLPLSSTADSQAADINLFSKVLYAKKGDIIYPEFEISLKSENSEGLINNLSDPFQISKGEVIVSASPKYNISLKRSNDLQKRMIVSYDSNNDGTKEEITGRMYGAGIVLQLYNDTCNVKLKSDPNTYEEILKGVKGIEIPENQLSFTIDLSITKDLTDLTNLAQDIKPIIWNYSPNYNYSTHSAYDLEERPMNFHSTAPHGRFTGPIGICQSNKYRFNSVLNSGKITMTQTNYDKIEVTVSDYELDGIFPTHHAATDAATISTISYPENIGCFSSMYFQFFVPENLVTGNYYINLSTENSTINSGENIFQQQNRDDDRFSATFYKGTNGSYEHAITLRKFFNNPFKTYLSSSYDSGDAYALQGQDFAALLYITQATSNDSDAAITRIEKLFKFDTGLLPVENDVYNNFNFYNKSTLQEDSWDAYYIVKENGWTDYDQRNKASITDIHTEPYRKITNLSEMKPNEKCVGIYFSSKFDILETPTTGSSQFIEVHLKIDKSTPIGTVLGMCQHDIYYRNKPDPTTGETKEEKVFERNNYYINTNYTNGQIIHDPSNNIDRWTS